MGYTPRRCSKRWLDGDCPDGVLAILDNRGKTIDRYTVIYREVTTDERGRHWIGLRDMSADPYSPVGYGVYNDYEAHVIAQWRYKNAHHYARWTDLPEPVQRCVRQDLNT